MKRIANYHYEATAAELGAVIESLPGAQPMAMKTCTVVDLKKTGNPFGEIVKFSHVSGMVGVNYGNAVNNQQIREGGDGDFEPLPPKWGIRVGKKLLTHKGNWYCPTKIQKVLTPPTFQESSTGVWVDRDAIKPYEHAKKSSAESQGVDKEIVWRTYKLDSILEITIGGITYSIVPDEAPAVVATTRPAPEQEELAPAVVQQ